jgi:endonuclease I
MKMAFFSFCAILIFTCNLKAQNDDIGTGLTEASLITYLRNNYTPTTPKDYDEARDSMYQHLDVDATDSLTCVYTGLRAKADGTRTPSNGSQSFNTEHSWPQSFYDNAEPMRGDIHHLYPVWSSVNSSRSNNPYAEINDNSTTSWWYWKNGGSLGSIPTTDIDLYSEYYNSTFEPREDHKGNAARAMFYFWTLYQTNTDIVNDDFDNEAFFNSMKDVLYQWHKDDPVDANEIQRSLGIESIQGNKNPFIHDTTLIRRAYFNVEEQEEEQTLPDVYISEVYEANGGTVKYVELFNTTDSDIDFTTNDWALLRFSNSNTSGSEATISLTGTIKAKSFYVIGDDNSSSGVQTIFGEGVIDQNESGINHNGNDKYTLVKDASGTPEQIDAFAGDNIGNSSNFFDDQVAYRLFSELPNNGNFGQTTKSSNGSTVSSGYWKVFDITSSNSNAKLIATPGYSKGIESSNSVEALITGTVGWRLLSIPSNTPTLSQVEDDITLQGVEDSQNSNVFTYNSSGSYSIPSSYNTSLNKGEGISVYFFDNNESGSSELPIKLDLASDQDDPNSDVSVALNTSTVLNDSYFTLVGNPFQKNFSTNSLSVNASLQNNIHLLENGLYYSESRSSAVILPWQGFWVESPNTDASSTLTFPISGKTDSDATISAYSKDLITNAFEIDIKLRSSKSFDRGCKILFQENAKNGWDIYDSSKLDPTISDFAILSCLENNRSKSVHSLPLESDSNILIPIQIDSYNVSNDLTIEWEFDQELIDRYNIRLLDTEINELIDLHSLDNYSFEFNSISTGSKKKSPISFSELELVKKKAQHSTRFVLEFISKTTVSNDERNSELVGFSLEQNYPNPFNPTTQIEYSLERASYVTLEIFNATGQKVVTLVEGHQARGTSFVEWDASNFSSGIYFARLQTDEFYKTIKMTLLK